MTNAEIIQAIRNEIERLKSIEYPCDNSQQATGFFNALDRMTDFLSTLESEKPVPNDLEEAAEKYKKQVIEETKCHHNALTYAEGYEDALLLIPDAFIAGAKWQKEQDEKEQADLFTIVALDAAQRAKEQMMKEAIHYVVQDDLDSHGASYNIPFIRIGTTALKPKGIGVGDKVRIIIVKED